ncbi:hypothetical protein CDAR_493221 [Caerostris darwini]|uniref:Uncharacterized protein n=1 Tax=Caerostris darwini TaxID=1538125 RepID=A0AAV4TNP5_9ARAC|nr:hypothetical protein CDAR_493221 [Caerostris darwini]
MFQHSVKGHETFLARRENIKSLTPVRKASSKALGEGFVRGVGEGDGSPVGHQVQITAFCDQNSGRKFPKSGNPSERKAGIENLRKDLTPGSTDRRWS